MCDGFKHGKLYYTKILIKFDKIIFLLVKMVDKSSYSNFLEIHALPLEL